jgi:hypothetical protein
MNKLTFLLTILLTTTAFVFSPPTHAQNNRNDFVLVDEGKVNAQIVIAPNAAVAERYAASELQRALQKMSGAELPIKTTATPKSNCIFIGTPQGVPQIKKANLFNTKSAEEIRIKRSGDALFLAGPTPSAALYAVYTFLQDKLGARWYWPGESGEYLPRHETLAVNALDVRHIPDIEFRSLSINSPHFEIETLTWMARNRMNLHNLQGPSSQIAPMHERGFQVMVGGHNAFLDADVLEKHPEYIAEVAGKRQIIGSPPHICWSNPGAQKALAEKIAQWWKDNPEVDSISFFGPDHNYFCECAQCQAYAPDVSTRWQKFSKAVIAEVNKTYPGKHYQTLAYQAYRDVPTEAAPFDLIGYTTYNINYTKPISDPTNAAAVRELKAWQKTGGKIGLRGYQFIPFNQAMYAPITGIIMEEVAWCKQNGLPGWTSEVTPFSWPQGALPQNENWITNRMALYAVAQAMWNVKTKPADLLRDWTTHIYGPAAQPMLNYHNAMETAWRSTPAQLSYFLQPPSGFVGNFLSPELLKKTDASFQAARIALAREKDAATRQRIEAQINLEAQMFDSWRQTYLFQQGRAAHLQAYATRAQVKPALTAEANDPAWTNIKSLPAFETDKSQPAAEATKVLAQWDETNLYLRFVNTDADITQLRARQEGHDKDVFPEDTIEMFLNDPARAGHYFHLAVNAKGTRYDAKADGSMNFEVAWNPDWTAKTSIGKDSWILDVALPFASFGITPQEATAWKMSFMRAGAERRPHSGWPDASVHNPSGFGTLTLVEKAPLQKRVALYDNTGLQTELARLGFSPVTIAKEETEFATTLTAGVEIVVLRAVGIDFTLSEKFITEKIQPFLRNGGLVLVSGYGAIPLDKWFGEEAAARWDGWEVALTRQTTATEPGDWLKTPHGLAEILGGFTPSSGFTPTADGWERLATQKLQNGEETAYLLRRNIGKGTLVVTSSDFGYGGGHEMFGSLNPAHAAMLLDNLWTAHQK